MAAWVEATEPVAYGVLCMTPESYESLQVREFYRMLESREAEEKRQDQKRAYFLSLLVSVQCTKTVSPTDILAPLYPELGDEARVQKAQARAEEEAYLREAFHLEEPAALQHSTQDS